MNKPLIGILWGDFPWDAPPRKFGKLLSWGAVARTFTLALADIGTVVPYSPSDGGTPEETERELTKFLRSIDILCADFYPATGSALRLRSQFDLPCPAMLIAGGTLPKGAEALLFPWQGVLRPDDALLFSCRADQEIWHELVEWSRVREYLIPCIVDIEVFHTGGDANRPITRQKYGLPADSPILPYVGRHNIQKNLHTLFRLFAEVRKRLPDAHLCLVGEEDDIQLAEFRVRNTGYREWLQVAAAHLGIDSHVTFLDSLFGNALADLYRASDIVVNLSVYHRENFGLSEAEAELCGLPVVCSDWGGFKDVVRHGETGYLLETVITKHGVRVNWRAGVDHVVRLLEDPEQRAEMGARAVAWAGERFTLAPVAEDLRQVVAEWRA